MCPRIFAHQAFNDQTVVLMYSKILMVALRSIDFKNTSKTLTLLAE